MRFQHGLGAGNIARDVQGAQAMLSAHLRSTMDFVYPSGSES